MGVLSGEKRGSAMASRDAFSDDSVEPRTAEEDDLLTRLKKKVKETNIAFFGELAIWEGELWGFGCDG